MAVGNTFGATALSSYGGFWIAYAILNTPHWNILGQDGPYVNSEMAEIDPLMADSAVGFFLTGWFIFTTILLLCTLRSTVMFFLLFFTLDIAFLMLSCGHYAANNGNAAAALSLKHAGGGFGMLSAFLAWYNAFAGIADSRYVNSLTRTFSLLSLPFSRGYAPTWSFSSYWEPSSSPTPGSRSWERGDYGCMCQGTDRQPLPSNQDHAQTKCPNQFSTSLAVLNSNVVR